MVSEADDEEDQEEDDKLPLTSVLFAAPWYVLQALLLWLPLSLWPPLAHRLKRAGYSWYAA